MNRAGKILSVNPAKAIPGGEVLINCEGIQLDDFNSFGCFFSGHKARTVGVSETRVLAIVPDDVDKDIVDIHIENFEDTSNTFQIVVGKKLADGLHMVANPAVDPKDDSIVLTRSGSRGHELPVTLLRLENNGFLKELGASIINPTGVAFDLHDKLVVTNRADGEACQINRDEEVIPIASNLGVATGIVFDKEGVMYIGDRNGTVFRVPKFGSTETWALLEPSVSAYHMAFDTDGKLYVTAPGLCSYDAIYRIDEEGVDEIFFKGLGRPQGLAFGQDGNVYVAACFQGRHGIVKISQDGKKAEMFIAGMSIVGLCFTRKGDIIVATSDSIFSLSVGISGTLLS